MIGKLLGHTHVQTTQRYAHLLDDLLRARLEQVGDMLRGMLMLDQNVSLWPKATSRVAAPDFGNSAISFIVGSFANPLQARCDEPIAGADHVESYRRGDRGSPGIL